MNKGLLIGLIAGGVALVATIVIVTVVMNKRKTGNTTQAIS